PGEQRENRIVERQKAGVGGGMVADACADTADDDRNRERQEDQREQKLARAARSGHGGQQRPDGAEADVREENADDHPAADAREEEREGGQRDELGEREEDEHRARLAEPDGAAIARRQDETVDRVVLTFGSERTREPEERREHDSHPQQSLRSE